MAPVWLKTIQHITLLPMSLHRTAFVGAPASVRRMHARMPALTMAMSSSRRCACLNSRTYSCRRVNGMLTAVSTSCGCSATRR